MSKIDLSKANVGDKFRTMGGQILEYIGEEGIGAYELMDENHGVFYYHKKGNFLSLRESDYDLLEQVIDKPLDELIEEGTKLIKENDDAIKEEQELQRRQEVVELAEKMYIMFEKENLRCCLSCNESTYYSEDLQRMAFVRASSFVNKKHEYLKEGKL